MRDPKLGDRIVVGGDYVDRDDCGAENLLRDLHTAVEALRAISGGYPWADKGSASGIADEALERLGKRL